MKGDFNGKVGENREEDTVGPYGVGVRNDNGERVVNFCKSHNLFATNTWFQQRKSAQHTWVSPDITRLKNEIRKLCREAKDKFYEDKCKEIEILDKAHSQLI